ncbi:MoxR family ATPase [Salinibacterium sp. dk2585]|uniref:AAA family ATPase n=1 Tax=unclassified Salinibacterium TaxID=2632331 RepID=UPI0011C24583|nr:MULTISPECIES: MoxR family ATPase [unclassified Salinibacterium]QEE60878.1 MoxR family ATPase [Salinibacterium sp. dk2585]TXK55949.1 MoxR family ATPase [Salinibacterium sp. dk5596]
MINETSAAQAAPAASASPRDDFARVRAEVGKAVVGQDGAVTGLIIALLAGGHVLLEGVPGVAKTLLVRTLSRTLALDTKRIQFTPDLMPGDVTGSLVYDAKSGDFDFREGPVFTNLLLADEINRTPPKTQSALLEAMEERQVSVDGRTLPLPSPFLVAATMNPVEYEGTYTLPEAQLDRFLLKLVLDVPERGHEIEVLTRSAAGFSPRDLSSAGVTAVLTPERLLAAQREVATVGATSDVISYVVDLARGTRESPSVKLGVSPRGTTALLGAAKAWAWLSGFDAITPDHVQAMVLPVWRHRLQLRPEAELEGVTADSILRAVLQQVRVPI